MNEKYKKLFEPIKIGNMIVKNHIETAPAAPRLAYNDGTISPEIIAWTKELAKGGAGIVTVGISQVTPVPPGRGSGFCVNMGSDNVLSGLAALADAVHRYGAKASIELASFGPMIPNLPEGKSVVDVLTHDEIKQWIQLFVDAAERAVFCGMDMILLHAGHGIFISNFVSPLFNHRTDEYGGSLENRARFACELLDAIRAKVGNKLAIEFRISGEEFVPGGMMIDESIEFVKIIQDKIDLIHVSAGMLMLDELVPISTQPSYLKRGFNIHFASAIKNAPGITVPVTTVGSIDMDVAAEALERGDADMFSMIRTVIADPYSVDNARTGKEDETRPCIRCVLCLNRTHGMRAKRVACAVNPRAGREVELDIECGKPYKKKKVVIVGGGPAGLQAARTAADRGHEVVLFEKSEKLGGTLNLATAAEFKADLKAYLQWAVRMTTADSRIKIKMGTEATPERVKAEAPDTVIVAVGAEGNIPPIPGLDGPNVVWVGDVEGGNVAVGQNVVIAGGGLTGCETALDLARKGKKVTVIEMVSEEEMLHVSPIPMTTLLKLLKEEGVTILSKHKVLRANETSLIAESEFGETMVPFDTLVVSLGVKPKTAEANHFADTANKVILIGDCTTNQGTLYTATTSGFNAAMDV